MILDQCLLSQVSVSAGCDAYRHWASFVIGMTSSFVYVMWSVLFQLAKVDDPLGVAAVHLGGGLWGITCVRVFQDGVGLVFTDNHSKACLAVAWNVIAGLTLGAGSALVTVLVLALPRALSYIPLSHTEMIQGIDKTCIEQQAYPDANKVTRFTTDCIEDRERFSNPASPCSPALSSPISYTDSRLQQQYNELRNASDLSAPNPSLDLKKVISPRRVWFVGDTLPEQVAPGTPLIDYHRDARLDDVEF